MTIELLLTTADVSRIIGLTPAGVRLAADKGQLEVSVRTPSGQRLYTQEAVDRYRVFREGRIAHPESHWKAKYVGRCISQLRALVEAYNERQAKG